MNTPQEIREIYKTGSGTIRIRANWQEGPSSRSGKTIYITSVPYTVNKATLVERIAEVALSRKLPHLVDVRDLSTDDVRIALELKGDANKRMVMAYLYKHTPLQSNFAVNLTCLVPTENPLVCKPERLELRQILWHFLHFRLEVVRARLKFELDSLNRRIHILDGFATVFDALDEILKIVRKSDGKADAAAKIMARFTLDAEQTDAILELKIYRLARLEILVIQQELDEKRKRASEIGNLLKRDADLWKIVRQEIEDIHKAYGDARRSELVGEAPEEDYTAEDFIIDEDNVVVVTRDGWVKRQKEVKDIASTRVREGDAVMAVVPGSTRATAVFFTNFGVAYTARLADLPASTGYGEPVQSLFKFKDGEKVVGALSLDPRAAGAIAAANPETPAAGARAGRVERRLQPPVLAAERSSSPARAPAASSRACRRRGDRRRRPHHRRRDHHRRDPAGARHALQGRRGQLPQRPRPRRHPHQAAETGRPPARVHRFDRRPRSHDGRDDEGSRADDQHDEVRRHRPRREGPGAAAARRVHESRARGARTARAAGVVLPDVGRGFSPGAPAGPEGPAYNRSVAENGASNVRHAKNPAVGFHQCLASDARDAHGVRAPIGREVHAGRARRGRHRGGPEAQGSGLNATDAHGVRAAIGRRSSCRASASRTRSRRPGSSSLRA